MKKYILLILSLSLLLAIAAVPVSAKEEEQYVYDIADYLSNSEEEALEKALKEASESGVRYIVYTSSSYIKQEYYPTLVRKLGFSVEENLALLAVYPPQRDGVRYGYNLAVFGSADQELSDPEYNEILNHEEVMDNIYAGRLVEGLSAFPALTQYRIEHGRDKDGGFLISTPQILFAGSAFLITFAIFFFSVWSSYRRKNKGGQYPLEKYSKTKITKRSDRYSHRHLSVVRISSSSGGGGGRSSGGGGGGARGGGR